MFRTPTVLAALTAALLVTPAFANPRVVNTEVATRNTAEVPIRIVQVVSGLEHPWAVGWLPDGRMLVTERPGKLLLVDGQRVTALEGLPRIHSAEDQKTAPEGGNQGGLMDVVVHPDYASNGWIYLTYTSPGDDDAVTDNDAEVGTGPALARARLNPQGTALVDLETIYALSPRTTPARHYGSRVVFPGDGTVLMSIGDRGLRAPAQDLTNAIGTIIRLKEDGGAADGNPFIGVPPGNLRPEIWSYGHRNNQGLTLDSRGNVWTTEHGPSGGDLLHRVQRGHNYGWPHVAQGREYSTGEKVGIGTSAPGVTAPVHIWEKSSAPSGLVWYTGSAFPAWQGQLFAGQMLIKELHRIVLDGDRVRQVEPVISGEIGRIRDVRQGPDGMLYVVTDEADGGVYRIEPARR